MNFSGDLAVGCEMDVEGQEAPPGTGNIPFEFQRPLE